MKYIYITLFSIIGIYQSIAQSAWTKKESEGYLQFQYNTIPTYDEVFQESGDESLFPHREQSQHSLNFYGEYGLTDKTTIIGHVPLSIMHTGELNENIDWDVIDINSSKKETITALGNIEFGVRHKLYSKSVEISGQLNVHLNTSTYDKESGIRTGYDAYSFIPTINIGKGWNKSYIQGFTGAALRTNDYFQSFKIGIEYGYKIHEHVWAIAFIDGLITMDEGDIEETAQSRWTYMYVNNQEYVAFGLKLNYELKDNFGMNLGFGGAFSAKRVAKKPSLALGIYKKI
ncbi:MAG: transporter [Flavobacteriales bacterium]